MAGLVWCRKYWVFFADGNRFYPLLLQSVFSPLTHNARFKMRSPSLCWRKFMRTGNFDPVLTSGFVSEHTKKTGV